MRNQKLILIILLTVLIISTTCKKPEKSMLVSTGEISSISTNTAEASGEVIDLGVGATQHGHCYSTTFNVTIAGSKTQLGKPAGKGGFTSQLTDLEDGTKYYVKAYLTNGTETTYGKEISFTTIAASLPTITTTAITSITTTTATGGGNITSDGGSPVTMRGVCWNAATGPTVVNSKTSDGSGTGSYSSSITGLVPGTLYYVRAYATNSTGTDYGNELSFTTNAPPTAVISSATAVINTTTTLNGVVNANGFNTTVTFEYGPTILYGSTVNATPGTVNGTTNTNVNALLTGLTPGTLYHFRVKAVSTEGTTYSDDLTFTTLQLPIAVTEAATSIAINTATLNGTVNAINLSTTVSFEYGTTISYGFTASATPNPVTGENATSVSAGVAGLTGGTTYHFRIKAESSGGIVYGDDLTFITDPPIQIMLTIKDATTWTLADGTLATVPDANVKLYSSQASFDSNSPDFTATSNLNGIATLSGLPVQENYFLVVEKADLSNIKDGYIIVGVFTNQEAIDAYPHLPGASPGDLKYLDWNGDGVIDSADKTWHDVISVYVDQTTNRTITIGK